MTEPAPAWKSDRRVRSLLERNMNEGESIRFVIEGMDGQCIVALDKRLLVVKPGSAIDEPHSGLTTSILYSDIAKVKATEGPSNRMIKIHTSQRVAVVLTHAASVHLRMLDTKTPAGR